MAANKRQRSEDRSFITHSVIERNELILSPRRKRVKVDGTYSGPSTSTGIAYCSSSDDLHSNKLSSGSLNEEELEMILSMDFAEEIGRINKNMAQFPATTENKKDSAERKVQNASQPGPEEESDEVDGIPMHSYVMASESAIPAIDRKDFQNEFLIITTALKRILANQKCQQCLSALSLIELLTNILCTPNNAMNRLAVLKSLETSVSKRLTNKTQTGPKTGQGLYHNHESTCEINSKNTVIKHIVTGVAAMNSSSGTADPPDTQEESDYFTRATRIFKKICTFTFNVK